MKLINGLYLLSDEPDEFDLSLARSMLAKLKAEVAHRDFWDRLTYRFIHDPVAMQIDVLEADLETHQAFHPNHPMKNRNTSDWLNKVARLGCIACRLLGYVDTPAQIHHIREGRVARNDHLVLPLCDPHHAGERPHVPSMHKNKAELMRRLGYQSEFDLLALVIELVFTPHPQEQLMTERADISDMVEVEKYSGGTITAAPVSMPERLMAIAIEKGASLEQLRELMDLQDRHQANIARQQFHAAMVTFKRSGIPEILKTKLVEHSGISYRHATLADVVTAVVPALAQHGISHDWTISQDGDRITVNCVLTHEAGFSKSVAITANSDQSGKKNPIQSIASAINYMQRYTLLSATGLAAQDMGADDDGRGGDQGDQFRLTEWLKKAASAPDVKELAEIKKQGDAVIRAREDVPAFEAFKKAIQARRKELDPDYASKLAEKKAATEREPGSEG